jgi:Fe-S cluster biogenesis protein NfuA
MKPVVQNTVKGKENTKPVNTPQPAIEKEKQENAKPPQQATEKQESAKPVNTLQQEIEKALETLRGNLQADGGDLELVEITKENIVKVQFIGACACCPGATMTLKFYIERALKETVPAVKEVVLVGAHSPFDMETE